MRENLSYEGNVTKTKVEILGRQYTLKGDVDPEYMQELAAFVNGKLTELREMAPGLDQTRLALLVCLNMADDLHQAKAQLKRLPPGMSESEMKALSEKTMNLISMLEEGIIGEKD